MIDAARFPRLSRIESPADLRRLPEAELPGIAEEMRRFLIDTAAEVGGHFGGGLGVVELTVALHWLFDTPQDRLVWDVGHQGYPHKVLTGRRDRLATIRQAGGLAPFLDRAESDHDHFGAGHSSTSIAAATGMALAGRQQDEPRQVVAITGDGAMTAGMAYEALAHAGHARPNMLVILNDNGMSISENTGAVTDMLSRLQARTGSSTPTLFDELGFAYSGPVDGHDFNALLPALRAMHEMSGPRLLHVMTTKGKGYPQAEQAPITYHAVGPFDPAVGVTPAPAPKALKYSDIFSSWLCDMAADDARLCAITPAMREGSGLVRFAREFPTRYHDVAIGEQHAVTLAAGMACENLKPVVAIYSTFLQRAYDQTIHDVALQNLDVTFAIDRAGIVGPDGPTHSGSFDLTFLRCLPNMVVMAPADENECRALLSTAFRHPGPAAVRYPRGAGPGVAVDTTLTGLPVGRAETRRNGRGLALLAFGAMVAPAEELGRMLDATVINMRFVKPLDAELIEQVANDHQAIVTIEDNVVAGGAGSAVTETLTAHAMAMPTLHLGLPDRFPAHGTREQMLAASGLDVASMHAAITQRFPQLARSDHDA